MHHDVAMKQSAVKKKGDGIKVYFPGVILSKVTFFLVLSLFYKLHCVKSVHIWTLSGPYFPAFGLNTDQKNSKHGYFSRSVSLAFSLLTLNKYLSFG